MNYPRRCWACRKTELKPTDHIVGIMRTYECVHCGATIKWANNPDMDGSHAEMHKIGDNQFSVLSMVNDPDCTVFKKKLMKRTKFPIQFQYDENDNKTHRWHNGRQEWVGL